MLFILFQKWAYYTNPVGELKLLEDEIHIGTNRYRYSDIEMMKSEPHVHRWLFNYFHSHMARNQLTIQLTNGTSIEVIVGFFKDEGSITPPDFLKRCYNIDMVFEKLKQRFPTKVYLD